MVQINFGQREVSCKIVFYGPGMSGKTTNLEIIHQKAPKAAVGEMVSIATETDRTLYFDFMPMDLGQVAGMHTKFMLYTVPGQIYYNATRKLVLQGVDGIIFVADSNPDKMPENLESLQNLRDNIAEMGIPMEDIPIVLQYNKRDLPNALSVADMNAILNPSGGPTFEACARDGKGVFGTLKEVSRLVIEKLNRDHAPAANRRRTAQSLTPAEGGQQAAASAPTPPAAPRPMPPPPPMPPRQAAPAPQPQPQRGNSGAQPNLPQRGNSGAQAQLPPQRPTAPSGANSMSPPRQAPPPPAPAPARNAPKPAAPILAANDPKQKHLDKAKPAPLNQRGAAPVNLGNTDPTLKRYQETRKSGGVGKIILWLIIGLFVAFVVVAVLAFVSPAVARLLPLSVQERIEAFKNAGGPPAAAPGAAAPAPRTVVPPVPAAPAPAVPAEVPGAVVPPAPDAHAAPAAEPAGAVPAVAPIEPAAGAPNGQ